MEKIFMCLFNEEIVKEFYGIDADYWDMYEYLYEIYLELKEIQSCLSINIDKFEGTCKRKCLWNVDKAQDIILKTNRRIEKIVKPWIDFKEAYKDDIQFGIKKQF